MSAAKVDNDGTIKSLDGKAEPDVVLTPEDVKDPARLARMLSRALSDIAELKRPWKPRRMVFRDKTVDATLTTKYRFEHKFGGRVYWHVVQWVPTVAGNPIRLDQSTDTDDNTLVLISGASGTATIHVEEAG